MMTSSSLGSNFVQIPVTYPTTAPEIALPELDGKTAKMYRYQSYSGPHNE